MAMCETATQDRSTFRTFSGSLIDLRLDPARISVGLSVRKAASSEPQTGYLRSDSITMRAGVAKSRPEGHQGVAAPVRSESPMRTSGDGEDAREILRTLELVVRQRSQKPEAEFPARGGPPAGLGDPGLDSWLYGSRNWPIIGTARACEVVDRWAPVPGFRNRGDGHEVPRCRHQVPRCRLQVPKCRYQVPRCRDLGTTGVDTRFLNVDTRCLDVGTGA